MTPRKREGFAASAGSGERKKIQLTSGLGGGTDGTVREREREKQRRVLWIWPKRAARIENASLASVHYVSHIYLRYNYYDDIILYIYYRSQYYVLLRHCALYIL